MATLIVFFSLDKPVSSIKKPACIKKTNAEEIITQIGSTVKANSLPSGSAALSDREQHKKRIDFFLNLSSDESKFFVEKNYNLFLTEFHVKIMVKNFYLHRD